ncbi:unnamed protein product, partial [Heterosigma akashiwo]
GLLERSSFCSPDQMKCLKWQMEKRKFQAFGLLRWGTARPRACRPGSTAHGPWGPSAAGTPSPTPPAAP